MLFVASIALLISIFVPIWRIELDAPQYPEGLIMLIYANDIAGDVEIINGLNHYIGMQTLHAENFLEFTILPYIIGAYALLMLVAGIVGRKKLLYFAFWAFVVFGIVAMADFWRWEYNYGHNLDPHAAIIVPGMSYQPPLIGYKVLLNFGAYSIPDMGGWLFVAAGIFCLFALLLEKKIIAKLFKKRSSLSAVLLMGLFIGLSSCAPSGPEPIVLHKDKCSFCEMKISDGKFGAELITTKGRVYKFDDLFCMKNYQKENNKTIFNGIYIHNFEANNELMEANGAFFVTHAELKSPMGGNTAAFKSKKAAQIYADKHAVPVTTWAEQLEK
ncbi:MAG TPA: hypothetical protein DIW47_09765 [Bacteroidetes bacterium]|nr:hypothetical protein [Bacteroidota bacterium]